MTTKARPPARTHRPAAVSGSLVLHASLLAVASCLPAGAIAEARPEPAPDVPALLTWARPRETLEVVVVTAPAAEAPHVPAIPAERVPAAEVDVEALPLALERPADATLASEPRAAPSAPTFEQSCRVRDLVAHRPGRDGPAAGPCPGPGTGGGIGVGGDGGPGGSAGDGVGGGGTAALGSFRDDGLASSSGDGTGRGGATCGPSALGELPSPAYPSKARARGWEGRVVLLLAIDAKGRVTSAEVAESSGRAALDDAALEAAPAWTFTPALHDGLAVAGTLRVPVRFELTD